jgi:hypothetical protein
MAIKCSGVAQSKRIHVQQEGERRAMKSVLYLTLATRSSSVREDSSMHSSDRL